VLVLLRRLLDFRRCSLQLRASLLASPFDTGEKKIDESEGNEENRYDLL
jgi:hypothetical protein